MGNVFFLAFYVTVRRPGFQKMVIPVMQSWVFSLLSEYVGTHIEKENFSQ